MGKWCWWSLELKRLRFLMLRCSNFVLLESGSGNLTIRIEPKMAVKSSKGVGKVILLESGSAKPNNTLKPKLAVKCRKMG